ncbi:hypothetical protein B0H13DRAFT_2099669 [Mycena leptocephala]|nr:hypothetical protein B0H13DRAFT_2099669 [Mycena leptocephala]
MFSAAGYACLVFDCRHWGTSGASDGTRRNCVYVSEQQDGYRTVIKYARQQPQFETQRVVVWGFSIACRHILTLASDPALNVAASMAQNPYCGRQLPPFQFNRRYITLFTLGLLDLLADLLHLPPVYIPTGARRHQCPRRPRGLRQCREGPKRFSESGSSTRLLPCTLVTVPTPDLCVHLLPCLCTIGPGKRSGGLSY